MTQNQIKEIVETALDREVIDFNVDDNLFEKYGLDSMGVVVMAVEIQRLTNIIIPEASLNRMQTSRDYLNYLDDSIKNNKANNLINA